MRKKCAAFCGQRTDTVILNKSGTEFLCICTQEKNGGAVDRPMCVCYNKGNGSIGGGLLRGEKKEKKGANTKMEDKEQSFTRRTLIIRSIVKWFFGLCLLHVLALLLYSVLFAPMVRQSVEYKDGMEKSITVFFSFLFLAVLSFWETLEYRGDSTEKHRQNLAMKEADYRFLRYLGRECARFAYRLPMYLLFQLPMLMFYSMWGYYYLNQHPIEKFYAAEAGFYVLAGNGVVGWLLSGAVWMLFGAIGRYAVIRKREEEYEDIDRPTNRGKRS